MYRVILWYNLRIVRCCDTKLFVCDAVMVCCQWHYLPRSALSLDDERRQASQLICGVIGKVSCGTQLQVPYLLCPHQLYQYQLVYTLIFSTCTLNFTHI